MQGRGGERSAPPPDRGSCEARGVALQWVLGKDVGLGRGGKGEARGAISGACPPRPSLRGSLTREHCPTRTCLHGGDTPHCLLLRIPTLQAPAARVTLSGHPCHQLLVQLAIHRLGAERDRPALASGRAVPHGTWAVCPQGRLGPSAAIERVPEPEGRSPVAPFSLPRALVPGRAWAGRSQRPRPQPPPAMPAMGPRRLCPGPCPHTRMLTGARLQRQL